MFKYVLLYVLYLCIMSLCLVLCLDSVPRYISSVVSLMAILIKWRQSVEQGIVLFFILTLCVYYFHGLFLLSSF